MIEPGHTCPTCERRVPHPRKPSSPETKVNSYRAPADEMEAHKVLLTEAAKHLGAAGRPHEQFWTVHWALVCVLQDESLRGAGQRSELAA